MYEYIRISFPQEGGIMDSRTRVFLALAHKEPDRVPVDFWAASEITELLLQRYG